MPTFEDLIGSESRAKLNDIVKLYKEAERDKRLKQYKAEREAKRRYVEATHFKTAQEMIDWVMSGNTIYSEYGDKWSLINAPTHSMLDATDSKPMMTFISGKGGTGCRLTNGFTGFTA